MRNNYLWYQFFRYVLVRPALRLFHSETTVVGGENIPEDKPVLFVSNHQNSFLDALHLVSNTKLFVHFLTRAEAFENPILAGFFRSINMLPVYRVRDGFSSVKKNEAIFSKCFERLKQGDAVLVFAEASQDLRRRIRPLSKGFTRIAFGAEEQHNWELDLQIIPVGISYSAHRKSRAPVRIEFGSAIPVVNFMEIYTEDEREAASTLKKTTAEKLKSLTMHVSNLQRYPLYHLLLDDLEQNRAALLDPGMANKRVALVEEQFEQKWLDKANELYDEAEELDINPHDVVSPTSFEKKDLLMSPLYAFSLVNNAVPYQAVRWVTTDYITNHEFDASAKFLLGLFLFPIYYVIISVALTFAGVNLPAVAGYFIMSFLTAPLFVRARDLIFTNKVQELKNHYPDRYESIKAKVEFFKELREELL